MLSSHQAHRHVCMMEGFDLELSLSTMQFDELQKEKERAEKEICRLKNLLLENKVDPMKPKVENQTLAEAQKTDNEAPLPQLPHEILLMILGHAVTSSEPITDPFYKGRISNMIEKEKIARREINVNFLATNKVYHQEGIALILKKNEIIFTQATAIANFAKIPANLRLKIEHATFRVVGRYYKDTAEQKFDLSGTTMYHPNVQEFKIPVLARPKGMNKEGGIQAYCFQQLTDFFKALHLPNNTKGEIQGPLLPSLKTMRIDLVNFCQHLSFGRLSFTPVIRWHLASKLDELLVTGGPEPDDMYDMESESYVLRIMVKDGGLFSQSNPLFISTENGLKPLRGYGISHQIVRPEECDMGFFKKPHPEGGKPPMSHPIRDTVFKWAFHNFSQTKKRWIEFDYATGEELELGWDEDYDSCDEHSGCPCCDFYCEICSEEFEGEESDEYDEGDKDDEDGEYEGGGALGEKNDLPELAKEE